MTKAEIERIVLEADSPKFSDRIVVNKPSGDMLNSHSFSFDADLARAMADTHIQRYFNATGRNLQATLWVDKKWWEQSRYFDQYVAVVTEQNAFKRKRAEQELTKAITEAPDLTDQIVGKRFVVAAEVKRTWEFDFDTMSKTFNPDLHDGSLNSDLCLQKVITSRFPVVTTNAPKDRIKGAGFMPAIIFQTPVEGSFTDLMKPDPSDRCSLKATFENVDQAEQFETIMTDGAVVYFTGEITMYESPGILMARMEKAELYSADPMTGDIEKTPFTWNVTKSLNPVETLVAHMEVPRSDYEMLSAEEYQELVDSPYIHSSRGGAGYVQFKDGGKRMFMTDGREAAAEYELREAYGHQVYTMVKAIGQPSNMARTLYLADPDNRVQKTIRSLDFFRNTGYETFEPLTGYRFTEFLQGDLEDQINQ